MRPAFVISPIGERGSTSRSDADYVLETFIRGPANKHGYEPYRGDRVSTPGIIVSQICESIMRDDLIFAYLKGENPNVYYELAIAHTLQKPVVLMKHSEERIPFDIGAARVISIDSANVERCKSEIEAQILAFESGRVEFASPIQIPPEHVLASVVPRAARQQGVLHDVSGTWSGFTTEFFRLSQDSNPQKYHASLRLKAVGSYVSGTAHIGYGDDFDKPGRNTAHLALHGTYRHPRFLRLHYDNDRIAHHCGLLFLEIRSNGHEAIGCFAGYGIASERAVHGEAVFRKAE